MRKRKKIIIAFLALIIGSNLPFITPFFTFFLDEKHYKYSNYEGTCVSVEFKSRNYKMMKRLHQRCLDRNPSQKDKKMYRLFSKNPFAFWRWRLYFYDERYKLPYRDFNEIKKIRGGSWYADSWGVRF